MHQTSYETFTRNKRASGWVTIKKSPYFASLRKKSQSPQEDLHVKMRNKHISGHKSPRALMMTNYQPEQTKYRKKMFKRINQFQQHSHIYVEPEKKLQIDLRRKPRQILMKNSKTVEQILLEEIEGEKYVNFNSIPALSPRRKQREKSKFRTKTRSHNSLAIKSDLLLKSREDEDWLSKQLILREVYSRDDEGYDF